MEYEIQAGTVTKEPQVSIGYTDANGDLYLYVGTNNDYYGPWLEIGYHISYRRSAEIPDQPLTELTANQLEAELDKRLRGDY